MVKANIHAAIEAARLIAGLPAWSMTSSWPRTWRKMPW
jgi:hypothetical protein